MMLGKRREMASENKSVFARIGSPLDPHTAGFFARIKEFISYINKHTFVSLAHWIAYHILFRIRNVYVSIKHKTLENPQGKKLIDAVRGRGEVKDHGASFYLRRISADEPRK